MKSSIYCFILFSILLQLFVISIFFYFLSLAKINEHICTCLQELFSSTVIGTVVLTDYNNNTYRIDDVDFSTTPQHSFSMRNGEKISYLDYYRKKYGIKILNPKHPMLVTRNKPRDRQAGDGDRVYLVPELCRTTGALYYCFI